MFKRLLALSAAAVAAIAVVRSEEESKSDESVVTLSADNFEETLANNERVLVEFYAPWCGHCKALAPEYEKAAQALKDSGSKTVLAKVDATVESDLASKFGVRGYPTLKYFSGGSDTPQDYTGGRTQDTIVQWIKTRERPAVSELADDAAVDAFKSENPVSLIARVNSDDDIAAVTAFAEANRETISVGLVKDDSGKVTLYRKFDEPEVAFEGKVSVEELTAFANAERFPLFAEISQSNYRDYVDRGLPLVWVAVDPEESEEFDGVKEALKPVTVATKGELSFVHIDNNKYAQHVKNLGIANVPGLVVITKEDKKYLFNGDSFNAETVKKFFDDYKAGNLEPFLKSQEIPESNDEDVYVLVGKSFDDVVGKDKDVLVEFYAPWCGHCKKLAPEYEKVGAAFKSVENMVVAKIDATENDTPEDIRGFPTLIFYKAGSNKGTKYSGGRTADAIIDYLKAEATVDVSAVAGEEKPVEETEEKEEEEEVKEEL